MKNYRKEEKKPHILTKILGKIILVFIISTISIVLYDMYINIEIDKEADYNAVKIANKVNTEDITNVSDMLEVTSKCVVGISKIDANDTSIFSINSEKKLSLGSGIVILDTGYILTNEHVSGAKYSKCYVTIENRRRIPRNGGMV